MISTEKCHRPQALASYYISEHTMLVSKTGVSIFAANFHLKMEVETRLILNNANKMSQSLLLYENEQDHKF